MTDLGIHELIAPLVFCKILVQDQARYIQQWREEEMVGGGVFLRMWSV